MTVRTEGTGRYRQARLVAVVVIAMLAAVALVFTVGAIAPFVSTPPATGRAGSAVLPSVAAPPVAAPQAPVGPMLGCGGDR